MDNKIYIYPKSSYWNNYYCQIIILIFCFLDMYKNFTTAYYKDGELIMIREKVSLNYLKNFFIYDIVSLVPTIINPVFFFKNIPI